MSLLRCHQCAQKELFESASVPPARSKRLSAPAAQDLELVYTFTFLIVSAKESCKVHEHASPCWRTRGNPSYWIRVLLPSRTSEKTPEVEQASTHVYVSVVFVYLATHSISGGRAWGLALISIQIILAHLGSMKLLIPVLAVV